MKKIKIKWQFHYVPEGQMEPDDHGRWAVYGYIEADIKKSAPYDYHLLKDVYGNYTPIQVCKIEQKGTRNADVPSLAHRFCCIVPAQFDFGSGFSNVKYLFSNDLDDLKSQVEEEFERIRNVLKYCRLI